MNVATSPAAVLSAAAVALALAGCATLPDTPGKEHVAAAPPSPQAIANAQRLAGAPGSTPPQPPSPISMLRTFSEATRDAKELPGLFNVWQRDDKVLIEIQPEQLER